MKTPMSLVEFSNSWTADHVTAQKHLLTHDMLYLEDTSFEQEVTIIQSRDQIWFEQTM